MPRELKSLDIRPIQAVLDECKTSAQNLTFDLVALSFSSTPLFAVLLGILHHRFVLKKSTEEVGFEQSSVDLS